MTGSDLLQLQLRSSEETQAGTSHYQPNKSTTHSILNYRLKEIHHQRPAKMSLKETTTSLLNYMNISGETCETKVDKALTYNMVSKSFKYMDQAELDEFPKAQVFAVCQYNTRSPPKAQLQHNGKC
jgi:hypothetical protein